MTLICFLDLNQRMLKIAIRRARNLALLSPMKGYIPQQATAERKLTLNTSFKENEVNVL